MTAVAITGRTGASFAPPRWGRALTPVAAVHVAAVLATALWVGQSRPRIDEPAVVVDMPPLPVAETIGETASAAADGGAASAAPAAARPMPETPPAPAPVTPPTPAAVNPAVALPVSPAPAPVPVPAPPVAGAASVAGSTGEAAGGAGRAAGGAGSGTGSGEGRGAASSHGQDKGDAAAVWRGRVLAHIERHRRYPAAAKLMKREGRSFVRFTMDRSGRILSSSIERGGGFKPFDMEAEEVLRRAQPLPAPPETLGGQTIQMTVPVLFTLAR